MLWWMLWCRRQASSGVIPAAAGRQLLVWNPMRFSAQFRCCWVLQSSASPPHQPSVGPWITRFNSLQLPFSIWKTMHNRIILVLPFPRAFFGGLSSAQKVWAKHVTRVTETLLLKLHVYFLFKWGFFKSIPLKMIVYLLLKKTQSQTTRCGHHPSSFFGFCFLKNVYQSITNKQKSVHIKRLQLNEAVTKGTHQCIKNPGQDHD